MTMERGRSAENIESCRLQFTVSFSVKSVFRRPQTAKVFRPAGACGGGRWAQPKIGYPGRHHHPRQSHRGSRRPGDGETAPCDARLCQGLGPAYACGLRVGSSAAAASAALGLRGPELLPKRVQLGQQRRTLSLALLDALGHREIVGASICGAAKFLQLQIGRGELALRVDELLFRLPHAFLHVLHSPAVSIGTSRRAAALNDKGVRRCAAAGGVQVTRRGRTKGAIQKLVRASSVAGPVAGSRGVM